MSQEPTHEGVTSNGPMQPSYQPAAVYRMDDSQAPVHSSGPMSDPTSSSCEHGMQQPRNSMTSQPASYYPSSTRSFDGEEGASHSHPMAVDSADADAKKLQSSLDEANAKSVFVGNVDYGTTPPELQEFFQSCGPINRITIMIDRYTGHPKGYAYIEFQDESALPHAMALNQSMFRDRPLTVALKRKNVPGYTRDRRSLNQGAFAAATAAAASSFSMFMRGGKMRGRGQSFGYMPRMRGRGGRGLIAPY